MVPSVSSSQISKETPGTTDAAGGSGATGKTGTARIDIALLSGDSLLVYGWILDLSSAVKSASVHFANTSIDLVNQSARLRRPDVAQHFSRLSSNEAHGFYALVDLPEGHAAADQLTLSIVLASGESIESQWPVQRYEQAADPARQSIILIFRTLIGQLSRIAARRLVNFMPPHERSQLSVGPSFTLPPPIRFEIELCCILEDRILAVYGWLFDPADELKSVELKVGALVFDLFEGAASLPLREIRPDPAHPETSNSVKSSAFLCVKTLAPESAAIGEVRFAIDADFDDPVLFTHPLCMNAHDSRQQLFTLIDRLDAESAMVLAGQLASVSQGSRELSSFHALMESSRDQAIVRLPESIQKADGSHFVHLDRSFIVGGEGIFLLGWVYAEKGKNLRIECHCGDAVYDVPDNWIRHPRLDVSTHLMNHGITKGDHLHGFSCYLPIEAGPRPCYFTVTSESGETRRMRVSLPKKALPALQTVHALLGAFDAGHRELRMLLDRQIGPAVQAVWATRTRSANKVFIETFGARPASPAVSIIVPLFGRCDFAEYQLALFADDEDFKRADLIYVVDDPAIFDQFRAMCPNHFGIYQVPFTVVFPGENLGFAAANNLGVENAHSTHTVFLNSDVLPKRHGWVGELQSIYASLESPGLLGAKLLYEDGAVQHAGIAFRRHMPWGGLFINDHPLKGQNPTRYKGTPQVDAVTAACAMIETRLFRELGGFSEDYIVGDFEDSDLCLRACMAGRKSYVALDVELYHLERQSQQLIGSSVLRNNLTIYNCWLHNQRWSQLMEQSSLRPFLPGERGSQ
jgi:GT2 family glycosyltransferase